MLKWTVILMSCLFLKTAHASSTHNYTQYGASDNLPVSEAYELMEDRRGYIWALTDNGVYRFNGFNFEEIEREEGLKATIPIDLKEDQFGHIWVLFLDGHIGLFHAKRRKIIEHPMNGEVYEITKRSKYIHAALNNSLKISDDGGLIFSFYHLGYFIVYPDSFVHHLDEKKNLYNLTSSHGLTILSHSKFGMEEVTEGRSIEIAVFGKDTTLSISEYPDVISGGTRTFLFENADYHILVIGNMMLKIENRTITKLRIFDAEVLGITKINTNELLVLYAGDRPEVIDSETLSYIRSSKIPFKFITYSIKDSEGGVWFSTLYDGIIHIPQLTFSKLKKTENKQVSALDWINNKVYYGTLDGEIGTFENGVNQVIVESNSEKEVLGFPIINDTIHVLTRSVLIKLAEDNIENRFPNMNYLLGPKDFLVKDNILFLARNNGLEFIRKGELFHSDKLIVDKKGHYDRIEELDYSLKLASICNWNNSLIGAIDHSIQRLNLSSQKFDTLYVAKEPIQILRANQGAVFYVTDKGVFWIDPMTKREKCILASDSFEVNDLSFDATDIWVATTNGVFQIKLDSATFSHEVAHYKLGKSFNTININKIIVAEEKLYLGTSDGVFQLPLYSLEQKAQPIRLYLNKIENNGEEIDRQKEVVFDYRDNSFSFYLDLLNTNNRSDIIIYYRLSDDQKWQQTVVTKIEVPFLSPNDYTFQAKACLNGNCSELQVYEFTIAPPIWERLEIRVGILLLFLFLVFWFYRRRLRKIKKEQRTERRIHELEKRAKSLHQQALSAQMNPHFMFNALSSIQAFILENDRVTSEKYLTDFAHLMRLILESSMDDFIEIDKEVKLLEAYLSLEQLRFEFSFDFEVICGDELLDEGLKIPGMILQPLVENAIIHGVNDNAKGKITVRLIDDEKFVLCEVEDNGGNGTNQRKLYDGVNYESRASKIISDRIEILKTDHKNTSIATYRLEKGTLVKITLPIIP